MGQFFNRSLAAQGSKATMTAEIRLPPRESMDFDVVIAGAGPAGLAAAIRLKQLSPDVSVVVVEKGGELGAHILSGAVIDPCALDKLLPDWRQDQDRPLTTQVTADRFYVLGPASALRLPNFIMPRLMNNHRNFIGSLGNVVRFLGAKAAALGVDIFPGFAAAGQRRPPKWPLVTRRLGRSVPYMTDAVAKGFRWR
jgi:electron-transferring-flavoprotein dehydrogenase